MQTTSVPGAASGRTPPDGRNGSTDEPWAVPTPGEMRALGARIAELAQPGDLVVLSGPLGAGKTVLVQGIAAGLGVVGPVTSPTFVLARVHTEGRMPLVHVDAYRLGGIAEVDDLDLDADTDVALTVVEWGQGRVEQLASEHLRVEITRPEGDESGETRHVRLIAAGPGWEARLRSLALRSATRES